MRSAFSNVHWAALRCGIVVLALSAWPVAAAETESLTTLATTRVVITLATDETLDVRTSMKQDPQTIRIAFPPGRVIGILPERSVMAQGAIQEIRTFYDAASAGRGPSRWIEAMEFQLRGAYEHVLRVEPGRIVLDIRHPSSLASSEVEIGLAGGIILPSSVAVPWSERFRAMQQALVEAQSRSTPLVLGPAQSKTTQELSLPLQAPPKPTALSTSVPRVSGRGADWRLWPWSLLAVALSAVGLIGWRRASRARSTRRVAAPTHISSGTRAIEELVWRAFERQGYQLVGLVESSPPMSNLRLIAKDGRKAVLACIADGIFFEKTTVEQFLHHLQTAGVEQGYLVAPGAFTVPAQRLAQEHGLTLIGREQLMELLSTGAMSEYYTRQLQQMHQQLDEAQSAIHHYTEQLELMRRQRNEASWFLGEERAKTAQLEAQMAQMSQEARSWQTEAECWQQEAEARRKQWEESQWYLGEAKAAVGHLEEQLRALRSTFEQLQAQHQRLERDLQETRGQCEMLRQAYEVIRQHGERRKASRVFLDTMTLEGRTPEGQTIFEGVPRDVSQYGVGIETASAQVLPPHLSIRLRLPGLEKPLEASGRLVWERQDTERQRQQGGYALLEMSTARRRIFERALAPASAARLSTQPSIG